MKTSLKNLLEKTKRTQYISDDVLATAPKNKGKGTLEFFTLGKYVSDNDLEAEYEKRGLIPADINQLCDYDLKNRDKIDEMKYVASHWKDKNGKWCFVTFCQWRDVGRDVRVLRDDFVWDGRWFFAGVRKSLGSKTLSTSLTLPSVLEINGVTYRRV